MRTLDDKFAFGKFIFLKDIQVQAVGNFLRILMGTKNPGNIADIFTHSSSCITPAQLYSEFVICILKKSVCFSQTKKVKRKSGLHFYF